MPPVTGTLCIKHGKTFYTAHFEANGWIAAELVQYLDDIYQSASFETGILKLLGYTLQIGAAAPPRTADHWIELDLDKRMLVTNSALIGKAVRKESQGNDESFWGPALERIYAVLDARDFTVRLIR